MAPAFGAVRARLGLVALLFGLAAVAWWSTADRMAGMDEGPGTQLGALGWFLGVWAVMMAAMMLPSVAPAVALYDRATRRRSPGAPLLFAVGYLATWTAAGLVAYGLFALGRDALGDQLAWGEAGSWVAGGILVLAAIYEFTPFKAACLGRCRNPLGSFLGARLRGAGEMGARHGAWCVGCCWALMASLFALGVMSLVWMVVVAALIALEKTLPWGRAGTYATATVLLALGVALIVAPDAIPGLVVPGDRGGMGGMG